MTEILSIYPPVINLIGDWSVLTFNQSDAGDSSLRSEKNVYNHGTRFCYKTSCLACAVLCTISSRLLSIQYTN